MTNLTLFVKEERTEKNMKVTPHGRGRYIARSKHKKPKTGKADGEIFEEETKEFDVRFFHVKVGITERPSAYKPSEEVERQTERYGLAKVVD